ncbi:helix-turn-helix domain-containing protein [Streptomyces mutomycini]|uniref:helix-turn-helix domain-containing protein n=1 Tax=Streptomyces mutomycini TaxID=284036 RepID=UPI000B0B4375|nr:helix-turn-helix domain-containing protein [Streptomyces mutomycini]
MLDPGAVLEALPGEVLAVAGLLESALHPGAGGHERAARSCGRRTETAAAALHIHPNTLAYRLRRFGTLARRDLASTGALAEV